MYRILLIITFAAIIILAIISLANAETTRSTGISLYGTYWTGNDTESHVYVENGHQHTYVDVDGAGGWISFYTRLQQNLMLEFNLGSMGKAETSSVNDWGEDITVNAVSGALLGIHYDLFPVRNRTAFRPYVSAGIGPYWLSDIEIENRDNSGDDTVNVRTRLRGGGYAGAGMNFMMTSWFGVNFNIRYHFVNFNPMHDYSGWDYGLGLAFFWGSFEPLIQ